MNAELLVKELRREGIQDDSVLEAIAAIPRERFVPKFQKPFAYENRALPIDCGQTISQPYIVALMTETLELQGDESVLEIGTGSGYQTAILSRLARHVTTIERWEELSRQAKERLDGLGIDNVTFRIGDGTEPLDTAEQFDAIIVTAASPDLPEPLRKQLNDPGRIVIPIGGESLQSLKRYRLMNGNWESDSLCDCRFVKLIGKNAWKVSDDH